MHTMHEDKVYLNLGMDCYLLSEICPTEYVL